MESYEEPDHMNPMNARASSDSAPRENVNMKQCSLSTHWARWKCKIMNRICTSDLCNVKTIWCNREQFQSWGVQDTSSIQKSRHKALRKAFVWLLILSRLGRWCAFSKSKNRPGHRTEDATWCNQLTHVLTAMALKTAYAQFLFFPTPSLEPGK